MGLIDILNGMQNGPRGPSQPSSSSGKGGGMSPIMMALLGLVAYKAVKSMGGQPVARAGAGSPLPCMRRLLSRPIFNRLISSARPGFR